MTPEAINHAIRLYCGWKYAASPGEPPYWIHPDGGRVAFAPDYYADLNDMQAAIRSFSDEQRVVFRDHLSRVWMAWHNAIRGVMPLDDDSANAPASMRAEALLRTVGLWAEPELEEEPTDRRSAYERFCDDPLCQGCGAFVQLADGCEWPEDFRLWRCTSCMSAFAGEVLEALHNVMAMRPHHMGCNNYRTGTPVTRESCKCHHVNKAARIILGEWDPLT